MDNKLIYIKQIIIMEDIIMGVIIMGVITEAITEDIIIVSFKKKESWCPKRLQKDLLQNTLFYDLLFQVEYFLFPQQSIKQKEF